MTSVIASLSDIKATP